MARFILVLALMPLFIGILPISARTSLEYFSKVKHKRTAQEWFELGFHSYEEGQFNAAIFQFRKSIEVDPHLQIAYSYLASAYIEIGDDGMAISTYHNLLKINKRSVDAYLGLAQAKSNVGDIKGALKDIEEAEQIAPLLPEIDELRGHIALQSGKTEDALYSYRCAIVKDGNSSRLQANIGELLFQVGDFEEANLYLDKARYLGADDLNLLLKAALAKQFLGLVDSALSIFNLAVELGKNIAEPYYFRGAFFFGINDYQRALEDFNQAIRLNPEHALAYFNRAFSNYYLQKHNEALADFSKAIKLAGLERPEFYDARADLYLELGKEEEALADYNQIINRYPLKSEVYLKRARVMLKLEKYTQACQDLEIARNNGIFEAEELIKEFCNKTNSQRPK